MGCGIMSTEGTLQQQQLKDKGLNPESLNSLKTRKMKLDEVTIEFGLTQKKDPKHFQKLIQGYLDRANESREEGNFQKQIEYFEFALCVSDERKLPRTIDYAGIYNNIGVAYGKLGKYKKATNKFIEGIQIYYQVMGLDFNEMLTILQTNLAINSKKTEMKKMAKSMVHFKDSKVKGGPSLSSSQLPQTRGSETSYSIFRDVLMLSKEINGENHAITAKIYQNIGSDHLVREETELALKAFEKALEIKSIVYGELSNELILSSMSVAHCHFEQHRYAKGLEHYKKAFFLLFSSELQLKRERKIVLGKLLSDLKEMTKGEIKERKLIRESLDIIVKNNLSELPEWQEICELLASKQNSPKKESKE